MKEPDWTRCTEEQLWKYVAIYTDGAYRSGDLDFVQVSYLNQKLPQFMKEIGFEIHEGRH